MTCNDVRKPNPLSNPLKDLFPQLLKAAYCCFRVTEHKEVGAGAVVAEQGEEKKDPD